MTPAQARVTLALGLIVALALRVALAGSGGNAWDLDVYKSWAKVIAERGAVHAYDGPVVVDYPPVFLYYLDVAMRLFAATVGDAFDAHPLAFTYLIRAPGIVLDVLLAGVIYWFVARRAGTRWALGSALAYAFNPAILFTIGYWGMPDSPHGVIIVGALLLALSGRPMAAWALISVGVFTKPQADIFAPVVALITLRDGGLRACLRGCVGIVIGVALATGPFLLAGTADGILNQFLQMADYDPFISNNAHNVWWLVGWGYGLQIRDLEPFLGPLSYRVTAALTLFTVFLFALWRLWLRKRDESASLEIAAYIGLALFMLMTVVHENHVYAVLPLLSLILWRDRRVVAIYLAITVVNLVNLTLADTGVFVAMQRIGLHYWLTALTLANAVGYLAVFLWWTASVAGLHVRGPVWRAVGVGATLVAAVAVFVASPQLVSATYRPNPGVTPSDAVWNGQIRLLDYRIVESRLNGGEVAHVTFTWQAVTDIDAHYMLFVHALDAQNRPAGQVDGPPTRNAYPTRVWRAGDVIHDQRAIPIARDAFGVYRIEIGFYPLTDFKRLRVTTAGRTDDRLVLGTIVVPPRGHDRPATMPVVFGDAIALYPPARLVSARAGQSVEVPLTFAVAQPVAVDYTVFVQVLDGSGRVVAQHDSQPADARFPTSVWRPGDVTLHTARLVLPPTVAAGQYRVIAGLYDLTTGHRLRAPEGDHTEIGRLQVTP